VSNNIPVLFDGPLAPHHKLIGQWVAARTAETQSFTRPEARRHIERVFSKAVHEIRLCCKHGARPRGVTQLGD